MKISLSDTRNHVFSRMKLVIATRDEIHEDRVKQRELLNNEENNDMREEISRELDKLKIEAVRNSIRINELKEVSRKLGVEKIFQEMLRDGIK